MEKMKYNVLTTTTGNKEVVRISVKMKENPETGKMEDMGTKAGHIASYALKALIRDKRDVYLSYISSAESKLADLIKKKEKILILMNRMLEDSLEQICGDFDKVPAEFVGKKFTVLTSLPYNKGTQITDYAGKNTDGTSSFKVLKGFEDTVVKATFVRLFLVETTKE